MRAPQPKQSEQRIKIPRAIEGLKVHPAAAVFPTMTESRFAELVESMREHGYDATQPVVVHEGEILDGRHRAFAAKKAGVDARAIEWNGQRGSPAHYAASTNLHRRDLTASQRAMITRELGPIFAAEAKQRQREGGEAGRANRAANEDPGSAPAGAQPRKPEKRALAEAAAVVGAKLRSAQRADRVAKHAPDLVDAVTSGQMSVAAAEKEMRKRQAPVAEQTRESEREEIRQAVGAFIERLVRKYPDHQFTIVDALRAAIRERLWR